MTIDQHEDYFKRYVLFCFITKKVAVCNIFAFSWGHIGPHPLKGNSNIQGKTTVGGNPQNRNIFSACYSVERARVCL
jgi:hypothetical protein